MYLLVDPREEMLVRVSLWDGKGAPRFFVYTRDRTSLLGFVVKKWPTVNRVLRAVYVIPGPGNFSTVRTAVTLANTLGFALGIPVVAVRSRVGEAPEQTFRRAVKNTKRHPVNTRVKPVYGREPNITKSKK